MPQVTTTPIGHLAHQYCGKSLPLEVLQSGAGFYIGTADDDGPVSRESNEYFRTRPKADAALRTGSWSQKTVP